ncbi:hypothetical protein ABT369_02715 [Dactylosporangium sp. NPDC000244]|uniref:hypothetical protein n=1 Tax=Dactylosporangium sp. NPDC000244 TaxID=3154365 RepID=UPI00331ED509
MTDEPLIHAAFEAIAATAPPPERVRARIAARARVHRQRRTLLVGAGALGGAAAATAVGVPLLARSGSGVPAGPAAPSVAAGTPFRFGPGWLPDGVSEQYRQVTVMPSDAAFFGSRRSWLPPGVAYPEDHSPAPGITLTIGERFGDADAGEPVTLGQARGRLAVTDMATVSWEHEGTPIRVTAYQLPNQADLAVRVARSLTRSASTLPLNLTVGFPARFGGRLTLAVHPRPGGWLTSVTSETLDRTRSAMVVASTGEAPKHTYAQFGRPGGITLWVPDEQDPSANFTRDEVDQALMDLAFKAPDLSWVGGRVA